MIVHHGHADTSTQLCSRKSLIFLILDMVLLTYMFFFFFFFLYFCLESEELRRRMLQSILLVGGSSMMAGMANTLRARLQIKLPFVIPRNNTQVEVIANPKVSSGLTGFARITADCWVSSSRRLFLRPVFIFRPNINLAT